MGIDRVHDIILEILDKDRNVFVTHEQIDLLLDTASMSLFNKYYDNPMRWRADVQKGTIFYGGSQRIDDALSPFKEVYTFAGVDTPSGVLTAPANFAYRIALYKTVYDNDLARNVYYAVDVINEEELIERLESQLRPVSLTAPIAISNKDNKFQLFPEQAQSGKLFYFRRPAIPEFAYTMNGRVVVFDSGSSTDLEWRDNDTFNVISIALEHFGIKLNAQDVAQFAMGKQEGGA